MAVIDLLVKKAQAANKKLVLPEGHDQRVVSAAEKILAKGVAKEITVLGTEEEIKNSCEKAGISSYKFKTIDPAKSDLLGEFIKDYCEARAAKGKPISEDDAKKTLHNRLYFGNMMTKKGIVDGLVAGSIASTPDMLRAAFQVLGTAKGIKIGSSCFVMDLKTPTISGDNVLIYADCGVNPNPNAEELVDIAMATAGTYRSLIGKTPKIAFLSFSTYGSAKHEILEKIVKATALTKEKVAAEKLDIVVDGELQGDAALVPEVAKSKAPGSAIVGDANVLIFPDLNAGNICYKLTQRLAGADAYGPILQGLAKPVNDLSRGCSSDDIFGVAAITVCQSL
ncbi:MAG: phosphate acetyltransferase [Chitinivibrionia bacterium]|nr:phosphate acetyltransferase [Chitinivibrionia bacterium]MCL1946832.1 phosphate acetyltransferase [Chitinivibrionia bacterium]